MKTIEECIRKAIIDKYNPHRVFSARCNRCNPHISDKEADINHPTKAVHSCEYLKEKLKVKYKP